MILRNSLLGELWQWWVGIGRAGAGGKSVKDTVGKEGKPQWRYPCPPPMYMYATADIRSTWFI